MPTWLLATTSTLAGGCLTIFAGWLADSRLTRRERERRIEEYKAQRLIRRDDFQRDTLLALQVAAQSLLRATGQTQHADKMNYRTSGKWGGQLLPDNVSDYSLKFNTEVMLLASRVRDRHVRTSADKLRLHAARVGLAQSESESVAHMNSAVEAQAELIQRVGELLRDIDEAQ